MVSTNSRSILFFISNPQRLSGSNRSLMELVTNLPDNYTPTVVCAVEGMVADAYREQGISVEIWNPGKGFNVFGKALVRASLLKKLSLFLFQYLPFFVKYFFRGLAKSPHLIHINDRRGMIFFGPLFFYKRNRIVAHARGISPFRGFIHTFFYKWPAHLVCVAEAVRREIPERFKSKASTVFNGSKDISHLGSPKEHLQKMRKKGDFLFCTMATITPFKGHYHLLHALKLLKDQGFEKPFRIICVGDLAEENKEYIDLLKAFMARHHIENLLFEGWQSDPFSFYKSADAALMVSVESEELYIDDVHFHVRGNEGLPRTNIEAMMFKLPIIGTRIAGTPEQIEEGVNGYLVPPSAPKPLAEAIKKMVLNPEKAKKMGEQGRKIAMNKFSTDIYVSSMVKIYEKLLA